jgi:hypothetical protein
MPHGAGAPLIPVNPPGFPAAAKNALLTARQLGLKLDRLVYY